MTEKNPVRMAAQLYEARDTARQLLGASYSARMAQYGSIVRTYATKHRVSDLHAATRIARLELDEGRAYTATMVLAAAVELTEPSAPAAPTDSEG